MLMTDAKSRHGAREFVKAQCDEHSLLGRHSAIPGDLCIHGGLGIHGGSHFRGWISGEGHASARFVFLQPVRLLDAPYAVSTVILSAIKA